MGYKIPSIYTRLNDTELETYLATINSLDKIKNYLNLLCYSATDFKITAYLFWLILLSLSKHDKQIK